MYYNDSTRRLNLLSGLVFGAVLGAGLALLFAREDAAGGARRLVVRAGRLRRSASAPGRDGAADDDASAPARPGPVAQRRFEL